jgi:hypothetical protein
VPTSRLASLVLLVLIGCRARGASAVADEAAWTRALVAERAANDTEMRTSVTSPFAAIERHMVPAGAPTFVEVGDAAVTLTPAAGAGAALALEPQGTTWTWRALGPGLVGTDREGKTPAEPGVVKAPVLVRLGATAPRFSVLLQPVDEALVATVYDTQAATLAHFHGLVHFAPDPRFAVNARLVRRATPETVELPTMIGLQKRFVRLGELRFEVGGQAVALTAFQIPGVPSLFVPFRDATSGKASYGAGRYLDLELPPSGDTVLVDFNRAYSPLCSYSPAFNCPIPPAENQLAVAILAGEKTYPR